MEKYILYKVTFPNNKVYIGITSKTLEKRKLNHYKSVTLNSNFKFHNALRKYQGKEIWEHFCSAFTWKDVREKMSSWQKGRKLSQEHKKKLSEAKLGKKYGPRKPAAGANIAKSLGMKSFQVFDKDKVFVGEFNSAASCARYLKTYSACISRCLKNPQKYRSYKGYTFKFINLEVSYFTL